MTKTISQREARKLKARVRELENAFMVQRRGWRGEWPSSVVIARINPSEATLAAVKTARMLKHAVIAVPQSDNTIALFADEIQGK